MFNRTFSACWSLLLVLVITGCQRDNATQIFRSPSDCLDAYMVAHASRDWPGVMQHLTEDSQYKMMAQFAGLLYINSQSVDNPHAEQSASDLFEKHGVDKNYFSNALKMGKQLSSFPKDEATRDEQLSLEKQIYRDGFSRVRSRGQLVSDVIQTLEQLFSEAAGADSRPTRLPFLPNYDNVTIGETRFEGNRAFIEITTPGAEDGPDTITILGFSKDENGWLIDLYNMPWMNAR